jgi:drug/metabolite transporter (DMT)-like permease
VAAEPPFRFAGELCALGTALCWSIGSNLFAVAGRRMSSMVLNRLRIAAAAILLAGTLLVTRGTPWPTWASPSQTAILALSGLIGFVFGDTFYFKCLVILGPGRAALLASTAPLFTAALAWPLLGEAPGPLALLGIAMTLGGVFLVLALRARETAPVHAEGSLATGAIAGVLGAIGQAVGFVLSKLALRDGGVDALSATVIRIVAAFVAIWALTLAQRALRETLAPLRDRHATAAMAGGAATGPFLGVVFSLAAIQFIDTGVAASIIASYPILAILIGSRMNHERLTVGYLLGACIAVAGVVVLFLR